MQDDFKLSQHVDSAMTEVNSHNMLTVQWMESTLTTCWQRNDWSQLSEHVYSAITGVNSLNMLTVQSNDCGASQAESVIYDGKKLKKKNQ